MAACSQLQRWRTAGAHRIAVRDKSAPKGDGDDVACCVKLAFEVCANSDTALLLIRRHPAASNEAKRSLVESSEGEPSMSRSIARGEFECSRPQIEAGASLMLRAVARSLCAELDFYDTTAAPGD